jgi:hypothetical protein
VTDWQAFGRSCLTRRCEKSGSVVATLVGDVSRAAFFGDDE